MRHGDTLALAAMKKEYQVLARRAAKARAEADEYINIGSEFVAIHEALNAILSAGEIDNETLRRLDALQTRRERAHRILEKDSTTLFDRQRQAESDRDALADEIARIEWRRNLNNRQPEPHPERGGGKSPKAGEHGVSSHQRPDEQRRADPSF
ncbi:hypothetical protein [Alloalcanivorax xenomutans]|uniref:hypothetical protein n=1 Tax=Alloalcanivorax xenomutans TaxID=1094342 RepID=UPI000C0CAC58|nr:hypothetical protein [Alloalcanivorax xenomutans]MCE7525187.1 hypothetical protein [Alloalcanivorax xenomutans]PHS61835.1 MAG: hypothetical protein COB00_12925 [Alcanivorax sp.]